MNEKQIKTLLSADLSGESKIKESLKLNLSAKRSHRSVYPLLCAATAAACALVLFFKIDKPKEYEYNDYPLAPLTYVQDSYGAAGLAGLQLDIMEINL